MLDARRLPARRLQPSENLVEVVQQFRQQVIAIETDAVARMKGGRGAAHEHGSQLERLQMTLRREQPIPVALRL